MAAQWSSSESGILRKNKTKETNVELLVFGYACKLFRDDEKALYIDQGKHLIPWMGDDKLKIDRYDCRGALSDLRSYESSKEGFDAMRWLGLNESERKLEKLCDKERYYSLHINEEEEEMYKEEERKRQQTNAIQYSYDVPAAPENNEITAEVDEEEEEYIPLPELDVPVDIDIPKTVKENARIEKTALFVCKQGTQMEILIKAKQGDNPQFSFLNQGDSLYKYYRHVLAAFKSGRYQGQTMKKKEEPTDSMTNQDNAAGHYLHPSLVSTNLQSDSQSSSDKISIPTVPYKPSANCAYSQLVNRIQGNQNDLQQQQQQQQQVVDVPQCFAQMTVEQQQYYQYYYASQYYEYYKQCAQYQETEHQGKGQLQPPDFQLDPNLQNYLQQIAYAQYVQHHQVAAVPDNNSYAQIVSNVNNKDSNPYTASVPVLPPNLPNETTVVQNPVEEVKKQPPLLSLAQYESDDDDNEDDSKNKQENREVYKIPIGEKQIIIDKMAVYVSKNGEQFEEIVKAKGDPRFDFLFDENEYNRYYREKIKELKSEEIKKEANVKDKEKKLISPVSFSIKKPKDEQPKEIKSALPLEESDEEPTTPVQNVSSSPPLPPVSLSNSPKTNKITSTNSETDVVNTSPVITSASTTPPVPPPKNGILLDSDDPILEMIDLTDDVEERKDAKRAEDKIKDKLAAAAREKLASVSRDRALQLERKKKAAAFLKLKNVESDDIVAAKIVLDAKEDEERSRTPKREVVNIEDSDSEEKETRKVKKSSKKKKSHHKRKHSRSKSRKKSKKRRKRSESNSSSSSKDS